MEKPTLLLTGIYEEDFIILKDEIEHITDLIKEKNMDKALVCMELLIEDMEVLGLHMDENKDKNYFYKEIKLMFEKFSKGSINETV